VESIAWDPKSGVFTVFMILNAADLERYRERLTELLFAIS
jgi:hypothetical protein